ncbi:glutamate receptor 2.8 [Actinidia rufa]|uniref:Glutamate receptor n=1 Tax=Actinidia rufa TaxID=165716 RepID=A0A7J0G0B3_9ERIC|nr:glutamate receptor 2.8 [Actinidia rufa]
MLKPSRYLALVVVLLMSYYIVALAGQNDSALVVDVGVIVDADSISGKISQTCMMMALEDFYAAHTNHTTRIVLHNREIPRAMLWKQHLQAILCPQRSTQADFVIGIGNKTRVPILSPATNPSLSPTENPYFIRVAQNGSSQVEALTSIVKAFNWREGITTQVRHRSVLSLSATDDHILQELYKLMTMQTRVFVVHMLPTLASRLFLKAKEVGMMRKEYAWIITDGLTTLLDTLDPTVINSMQGVLGVKPYVPKSGQLEKFTERWRKRFRQENPETDRFELNLFGLWAYDSVTALAMAADRVGEREIGFWTPQFGLSKNLTLPSNHKYTSNRENLGPIIWPGDSNVVPKGWEIPTSEKKLRVGVPVKSGFTEFIKVERDSETKEVIVTGFCIDVFQEVMENSLPYAVQHEFIPFETPNGKSAGSYNDLIYGIFQENYDAVVGDVTIVANRSRSRMMRGKNAWIFMKPLTMDLWLTTGAFFIFTGFVVWVLEHRVNKEFRGPPRQQVGMIFWFSFSTLVFAHREGDQQLIKICCNSVGVCGAGTHIELYSEFNIKVNGFHPSKLKNYSTLEEYDDALSRGSINGGVAAIIDEIPYIRLFLARYCTKYTLVGPIHKTTGFGFAFPKGSPLVPDISRAIINMKEADKMIGVEKKWFGKEADCSEQEGTRVVSDSLTLDSFKGLFLISGISSVYSLIIFVFMFLYVNKDILASNASIWQKIMAMAKTFDEEEENSSSTASKKTLTTTSGGVVAVPAADCPLSPATGDHHNAECVFSQDEGCYNRTCYPNS